MTDWSKFYGDVMSGYAPTPASKPTALPGATSGRVTSRPVTTIKIDPKTGLPVIAPTSQASEPVIIPNTVPGPDPVPKTQDRLPAWKGFPSAALAAINSAFPQHSPSGLYNWIPLPIASDITAYAPPTAPTAETPVPANPGLNGLFGFEMSPNIPPQEPPPGMEATKWAGADRGGRGSPGPSYEPAGRIRAGTNGYTYATNGSGGYTKVGKSAQYAGMSPSQQYDAVNQAAKQRARVNAGQSATSRWAGVPGMSDFY